MSRPFTALLAIWAFLVPWCISVEASENLLDFESQASSLNVKGKSGSGSWVTTYFNLSLWVSIQGIANEQASTLARQAKSPSQQIIGVWIDHTPLMASRITLYKIGGKIFWEYDFKDGGKLTREVFERSSSSGRRFDMRNRNSSGDYLVIKRSGVLEIRDSYGLVTTARPVK